MTSKNNNRVDEFLDEYLEKGIEVYSGKELELYVLKFALDMKEDIREMSLFDISKTLKVKDTKIKSMIYDIKLRNPDPDFQIDEIIRQLEKNLKSAEFKNGRFTIEVDDLYTQKAIKSILKESGYITDSSFNVDLIKLPYLGLIEIAKRLYPKNKNSKFKDMLKFAKTMQANEELSKIAQRLTIPGTSFNMKNLSDMLLFLGSTVKTHCIGFSK